MSESDHDSDAGISSVTEAEHISEVLRALRHNDAKDPVLKPYLKAAHWIPLGINPFANLMAVFFTALNKKPGPDDDIRESSEIDRIEELKIFEELMKLVPTFRNVVAACSKHKRSLTNFIRMLQEAANNARNDDMGKTNSCLVEYLRPSKHLHYNHDEFPLPGKNDYSDRGWCHPEYALLLYPQCILDNMLGQDDSHLDIMHDMANGECDLSESEWPSFLYPQETSPDVNNDQEALFQGYLLFMIFRQIFTGPRSAKNPGYVNKGRPCKARLHNLTSTTGRSIAYTCIMARMSIRGLGWCLDNGAFDYAVFYHNIVCMFESDPEDPWVQETLAVWDQEVPGLPRSSAPKSRKGKVGTNSNRNPDPLARRAIQRELNIAKQSLAPERPATPSEPPSTTNPMATVVPAPAASQLAPLPQVRETSQTASTTPVVNTRHRSPSPPVQRSPSPPVQRPSAKRPRPEINDSDDDSELSEAPDSPAPIKRKPNAQVAVARPTRTQAKRARA